MPANVGKSGDPANDPPARGDGGALYYYLMN